jgi:hypothetical protein
MLSFVVSKLRRSRPEQDPLLLYLSGLVSKNDGCSVEDEVAMFLQGLGCPLSKIVKP